MLKKVLLVAGLVIVVSVLVIGAINRTNDKVVSTSNGRAQGVGNPANVGQAVAIDWQTVEGTVFRVDELAMTIKTTNGDQVMVENRPWLFALEQKFSSQVGDQIRIKGFNENGYLTVAHLQNLTNGKSVQLRDENGRPGWSGRGRGGGGG